MGEDGESYVHGRVKSIQQCRKNITSTPLSTSSNVRRTMSHSINQQAAAIKLHKIPAVLTHLAISTLTNISGCCSWAVGVNRLSRYISNTYITLVKQGRAKYFLRRDCIAVGRKRKHKPKNRNIGLSNSRSRLIFSFKWRLKAFLQFVYSFSH